MSIEDHPASRPMPCGDAQIWVACTGWAHEQLQAFMSVAYSADGDSLGCAFLEAIGEHWLDDDEIEADLCEPSMSLKQLLAGFSDEHRLVQHLEKTGQLLLDQPADTVIIHYGDGRSSYASFVYRGIAFRKLWVQSLRCGG